MSGTLYVVATPIGNLSDMTPRASEVLGDVALIAAEDTRHTGRLLSRFSVKTPLFALHDHNESQAVDGLIERLLSGDDIALVSDAGTPLVSDPGYRLVARAHDAGIRVSPVPGASALTAAISVAGLPSDRFCFEGFLPARAAARRERLAVLAAEPRTLVFYEARHRITVMLDDLADSFGGERRATIVREATKLHEQVERAPVRELAAALRDGRIAEKGEYVVVVEGAPAADASVAEADTLLRALRERLPPKEAAEVAVAVYGGRKKGYYQRLLDLSPSDG